MYTGNIQICLLLILFTRESSYCFQRILAIAILSVVLSICLSVTWVDQSKTVQDRIFTVGCLEDSSFRNHKAFP